MSWHVQQCASNLIVACPRHLQHLPHAHPTCIMLGSGKWGAQPRNGKGKEEGCCCGGPGFLEAALLPLAALPRPPRGLGGAGGPCRSVKKRKPARIPASVQGHGHGTHIGHAAAVPLPCRPCGARPCMRQGGLCSWVRARCELGVFAQQAWSG